MQLNSNEKYKLNRLGPGDIVSLAHNVSFWAQKLTHYVSFWDINFRRQKTLK